MSADTTLHFDIVSGISGDMSVGVLCGLGLDIAEAAKLVSDMVGVEIKASVESADVSGVVCGRLRLDLPHEHAHRTMKDIRAMLERSAFSEQVKRDAVGIFQIIADAEGAVHGKSPDDVHFHEVGALDSIFDIAVFAYGVEKLGIKEITSSLPVLGSGMVKMAHGIMPVPAPAVLKILEGVEIAPSYEQTEMTTPTGAAILKYYVKRYGGLSGKIIKTAFSTGTKTFKTVPNMLRGILIEGAVQRGLVMAETSIDDCTGEMMGHLFARLKSIATDITITQSIGKKNRPVFLVNVLCEQDNLEAVARVLFADTSTAGLRYYSVDRIIMDRRMESVDVRGETVHVKVLEYKEIIKYSPEWDDCVAAGEKLNMPAAEVYSAAKAVFYRF
ncbi:nickel pincer cofactor biosynthesis protein LarC [Seleniivibrio sp.]|uniref:nickel pincer cofactor biosynthesis protein LarC n=1 Tax=Seleniivibrio sp. TaxID=2898801 RepID=UPI0025D68182|nr:nickel pincer cofactor biosynthesis protein LarC [Seleniivibrio sp.]MCD8554449.1 nickel pincer cofactor biosynthesis protein LarC [Seleniivibrio sp.]